MSMAASEPGKIGIAELQDVADNAGRAARLGPSRDLRGQLAGIGGGEGARAEGPRKEPTGEPPEHRPRPRGRQVARRSRPPAGGRRR